MLLEISFLFVLSVYVHGSKFLVVNVVARIIHVLSVPRAVGNRGVGVLVGGSSQEIAAIRDRAKRSYDPRLAIDVVAVPEIPGFSNLDQRQDIAVRSINIQ